jgi:hypothetical protein
MKVEWFNSSCKQLIATLSTNAMVFNKNLVDFLSNFYKVMLGISEQEIVIKGITKSELSASVYKEDEFFPFVIASSYAKISNRSFMNKVSSRFGLDLTKPQKFEVSIKEDDNLMIIKLGGVDE